MLLKRHNESLFNIQKLATILHTYLYLSKFFKQTIHVDRLIIDAYKDNLSNNQLLRGRLFDVEYVKVIAQQSRVSLYVS